jgi:tRNA (adenine57-N1/adenine58-N1)-methyltransferase
VLFKLELKSGMRVVESGTGSGSLSTSIIRSLLPSGHLFTYEFNQLRAEKAREDFAKLGFGEAVTVTHRDVLSNGFILRDEEEDTTLVDEGSIDAVFLDLPRPQDAIGHAYQVLRKGRRLCNFSPCIEQVQKAVEAMATFGFYEIRTFETLSRDYSTGYNNYDTFKKPLETSEELAKTPAEEASKNKR